MRPTRRRPTRAYDRYANMMVNHLFLGRCRPARSLNLKRACPYPLEHMERGGTQNRPVRACRPVFEVTIWSAC